MTNDPQAQLQQVLNGRNQPTVALAAANIVTFQDWLFFGTQPDIFVNVGIVPLSGLQITYAVLVFQTPSGYILGNATIGTSNAQPGWTMNLALSIDNYSIQQYGTEVQAWAFAQVADGQGQYSQVQNYTVNS